MKVSVWSNDIFGKNIQRTSTGMNDTKLNKFFLNILQNNLKGKNVDKE